MLESGLENKTPLNLRDECARRGCIRIHQEKSLNLEINLYKEKIIVIPS